MSDDLRTRIAAVIEAQHVSEFQGTIHPEDVLRLADAVIQELGSVGFDTWLRQGMAEGWCGPPVCQTHDGIPTSAAEDEEWEITDPCLHIIRLYEDATVKAAVEANHAPSIWRATNRA